MRAARSRKYATQTPTERLGRLVNRFGFGRVARTVVKSAEYRLYCHSGTMRRHLRYLDSATLADAIVA